MAAVMDASGYLTKRRAWHLLAGMKIIVSIDCPTSNANNAQDQWQKTVQKCDILAKTKDATDIQPLGVGAWLILSENGLPLLGLVISHSEADKYPYRLAVMDECFFWKCGAGRESPPSV